MSLKSEHKIVAIYGRVSTEHEEQLDALDNQMEWYDDILNKHTEWTCYEKYIDSGLSGTSAKKRPSFLQMIEDAKNGCFDLIITREVSRFARNTVDTLQYTRELKMYGVEVFFIEDNIWTMDDDGELRLTIMATLAQDESRKISKRVKAGQASSRRNGVLYGNGNVLGYDRKDNTYVINEEQAESVKAIFNLYSKGLGIRKIATQLEIMGLKNSIGTTKWHLSTIQRILSNTIYYGSITYLKSYSENFLEQNRKSNLDTKKQMIQKVDIEPIIDKELWDECKRIRDSKSIPCNSEEKTKNKYGYKKAKCVWLNKLKCNCGSSFRRNKWRQNKDGTNIYGYQCYNQVQNGSISYREKRGLDVTGACNIRMVAEWKLDIMAKYIFENLLNNKQVILDTVRNIINENLSTIDYDNYYKMINKYNAEIDKNKNRINNLIELRVDGEITKDEFNNRKENFTKVISELETKVEDLNSQYDKESLNEQYNKIEKALNNDVYYNEVDNVKDEIVDALVSKIIIKGDDEFEWYLMIDDSPTNLKVNGNKNSKSPIYVTGCTGGNSTKIGYLQVLSFVVNTSEIKAFKNSYGSHVKVSLCDSLNVNVFIK